MTSYSVSAAITHYHKLGGSETREMYFTVLESGKAKIKALANPGSGEGICFGP